MSIEEEADLHFRRANELEREERYEEALAHLTEALQIEPRHMEALTLAGEIHLFGHEKLGVTPADAYAIGLQYFDRALAVEPKNADAWGGKALSLFYLERDDDALEAAEHGLTVLPLGIGPAMSYAPVQLNVAETLFSVKVRALLEVGKRGAARQALSEGFAYCPGSDHLSRCLNDFAPDCIASDEPEGGA